MKKVIITAPSLDPSQNVSGVSSVAQFIIDNNPEWEYQHFELGKKDKEKRGLGNVKRLLKCYGVWKRIVDENNNENYNENYNENENEDETLRYENCNCREERRETRGEGLESGEKVVVHYSFPLNTPSIIRDPFFMNYARKRGMKMVVHIHGGLFLTAPKIPFVLKRILKWVFSWDVPFVVLSEMEKELLQKRFGAKWVEVLPNCPEEARGDKNENYNENENKNEDENYNEKRPLVLGYLGRIEPLKGMSELLEACKRLKADGVPFKLVFAGKEKNEGEYLPVYNEKLNNENYNEDENSGRWFEYVGLVSGESKREFLRSLDVFVMPSYFEGLPMSLLETMSYGVVPVITPVGSVPTVVVEGRETRGESGEARSGNGLFVKVKDVDSIVEAVKTLHEDRDLLGRLGKNAQQFIADHFSAKAYIRKLNEIYRRV